MSCFDEFTKTTKKRTKLSEPHAQCLVAENGGCFDTGTPLVTTDRRPMAESVVILEKFMKNSDFRCFSGVIERCPKSGVPWATLQNQVAGPRFLSENISFDHF